MCIICSAIRPYTPDCDYEGLAQGSGVSTAAASLAPVGSLDEMVDYLTDGFWTDLGGAAHSYDTSVSNQITVNISGLSTDGQQLARWAFEAWESVADLEFVETTSSSAQIIIDDNSPGATTGYLAVGDVTQSTEINIGPDWLAAYGTQIGSYAFQSYMHEIGHALGLGHMGFYNNNAVYGSNETFANDSWQLTLMSYFDQQQNTLVDDTRAETVTPMMLDVIAVQSMYGAPDASSLTAGNTTYGLNHTLGNSWIGKLTDALLGTGSASVWDGTPFSFTIYDHSGYDIIDFSTDTEDQEVDLNEEAFSDVFGHDGNMAIARGTVIEEYRAGEGDDEVIGNSADNLIYGGKGFDVLHGGDGHDELRGANRADILFGGLQWDVLYGGRGKDYLSGAAGQDELYGGAGNDTLYGGKGRDLLMGGENRDLLFGNGGSDKFLFQTGDGIDVIGDFNALDDSEVIILRKVNAITDFNDLMNPASNHIAQVGQDVLITDGEGLEITLQNVNLSDLDANDFIF